MVFFGKILKKRSRAARILSFLKMLATIPWVRFNPVNLINTNKGVLGANLGHMWSQQDKVQQWTTQLLKWVEEGKIVPYVSKAFPFDQAAAAHHYIQDRKSIGKVVLVPEA